ncbi:MAG: thioredoxin [Thiohalomonadaceae bacterium]
MSASEYSFDVSVENFQQYVLDNSAHVPVLVDFWAPWCGPCQSLMPMLTKLAEQYAGGFLLAKVNIDEQPELAQQFGVRSVPTVKLVRHGKVADEFTGALPESQIRTFIDQYVERESDRQMPGILEAFASGQEQVALAQLQQLRSLEPDNLQLILCEVAFLQRMQDYPVAKALLSGLPANFATEPEVIQAKSRLQLAMEAQSAPGIDELLQRLRLDPNDHQARYLLASSYSREEQFEAALENFLELLRRAPDFQDGAARKGMLMVFDLLGGQGELVSIYRRKMFTALH